MADITIETKDGEEAAANDVDRTLGKVENEVEHHTEDLGDHENRIDSLEGLQEWVNQRIGTLETTIANLPQVPVEALTEIRTTLNELKAKIETTTEESTTEQSQTELPQTQENERKDEAPAKTHLVDRIL